MRPISGLLVLFAISVIGAETRKTPWTTSRVTGAPEAPPPYELKRVFPKLHFENPVDMANVPGSDRLFVAELNGKILSFDPKRGEVEKPGLALDVVKQIN